MKAGTALRIITEWNFTDPDMAKDWSVVAWAEKGTLTIRHNDGLKSDKMPFISRKKPLTPAHIGTVTLNKLQKEKEKLEQQERVNARRKARQEKFIEARAKRASERQQNKEEREE